MYEEGSDNKQDNLSRYITYPDVIQEKELIGPLM